MKGCESVGGVCRSHPVPRSWSADTLLLSWNCLGTPYVQDLTSFIAEVLETVSFELCSSLSCLTLSELRTHFFIYKM